MVFFASCLPEEEEFTYDASANLRFSADSVLFDTVFTTLGSVTKRFRVYNDAENAVKISDISLAGMENSPFEVAVNGIFSDAFNDVTLLGNDSMLVLVDVTIDPRDESLPFLVSDSLIFNTNGTRQSVDLIAYGQDAVFIDGQIIPCNTTWTADKPYVLYNSVLIDSLCTLTIEPGTRIYSHVNSYIFIEGRIQANGTTETPILFRNDRLEESYENAPGQWGGLVFLPGSNENKLEHVVIRNAKTGIYLGTPDDDDVPDLILGNSIIENMGGAEGIPAGNFNVQPGFGLLAFTSDAYVYNTLINNCELNTVGNYAGGNYKYEHCTFAAYSFDFFRQNPSVALSNNVILADESIITEPLSVSIVNSIIWGNLNDELIISNDPGASLDLLISNTVLKTLQYSESLSINENVINQDPLFTDPREFDYHLMLGSPAIDLGIFQDITEDLEGNPRDISPDAGAYEHTD